MARPILLVVSGTTSDADQMGSSDYRLLLEEGVLFGPGGSAEPLWTVTDKRKMQAAAQEVSERAWPKIDSVGATSAEQLGAIVAAASKLDVYRDFCSYYRNSILLERAVRKADPSTIDWQAEDVRPLLDSRAAVKSRLLPGWAKNSEGGATAWLKKTKWEWSARALVGFLEKSKAAMLPDVAIDVLGIFDVRNTGMIENVGRVLGHLNGLGHTIMGVSMHAHVTKQARSLIGQGAVSALARFSHLGDVGRVLPKLPAIERVVRRFCVPAHPDLVVKSAAEYAFRGLHRGYILQTLVDYLSVVRMLETLKPRSIVLASDAHRYSRLIVAAARSFGIPTVVLQHGALVIEDFYIPVVANQMLAWGDWCRNWFIQRGTPPERVTSVGFVRGARKDASRVAAGSPRKLLFAAQPLTARVNEELLSIVGAALERNASLTVTIRPHPGEGRRAELQGIVSRWPATVTNRTVFSPVGRSLEADLAKADAVIISQSTVGIDALTAGIPVFLLRHVDVPEPIPYLEFGCVLEANSPDELLSGIDALDEKVFRIELERAASTFLDSYVGLLGADSVEAAANAVVALTVGAGGSL